MPYARPTLTALRDQAVQDVTTSGIPGLDGLLRNAVLRVLSWVMSGLAYSLYGYLDWIARESVPFTATDEYLEAWAALIGVYRKDATSATGSAQFNGSPDIIIRSGTAMATQGAIPYISTADGTVDNTGIATVPIVATVTGSVTNLDAGTPISLTTPIAGVNGSGITVGPVAGGADQETNDELRTRMLTKYREPPQGGAISDYEIWAEEVPGVTRVWVEGNGMGPGTVLIYPMFDVANADNGGFPQGTDGCATDETRDVTATGDQLIVADHIWPLQPVTALVYVAAPTPFPIDITLTELDPNTADMQDQIVASLDDAFLQSGQVGGIVYPSQLYEAILATPGINHFTMLSPALEVDVPAGGLPVMGTLAVS